MTRGLVFAGGGVAGIAWEPGVLLGIRDEAGDRARPHLDADLVVGASAGSTVGSPLRFGDLDPVTASEILADLTWLTAR